MNQKLTYLVAILLAGLFSCKKAEETKDLWKAVITPASPISESAPLSGTLKGTMLAGKTYTVVGDIFVNSGDTLIIEPGVTTR